VLAEGTLALGDRPHATALLAQAQAIHAAHPTIGTHYTAPLRAIAARLATPPNPGDATQCPRAPARPVTAGLGTRRQGAAATHKRPSARPPGDTSCRHPMSGFSAQIRIAG
jgi:hypothetical protein